MAKKISAEEILSKIAECKEDLLESTRKVLPALLKERIQNEDSSWETTWECLNCKTEHTEPDFIHSMHSDSKLKCDVCGNTPHYLLSDIDRSYKNVTYRVAVCIKEDNRAYFALGSLSVNIDKYFNNEWTLDFEKYQFSPIAEIEQDPLSAVLYYKKGEGFKLSKASLSKAVDCSGANVRIFKGFPSALETKKYLMNAELRLGAIEESKASERETAREKKISEEIAKSAFLKEMPELPTEAEWLGIISLTKQRDTINQTCVCENHCLECGAIWLDERLQRTKTIECPYCGNTANHISHPSMMSSIATESVIFVSATENEIIIKYGEIKWKTETLNPDISVNLYYCYVISNKATKYYSSFGGRWEKATASSVGVKHREFRNIFVQNYDGLLKYSGLKEYIDTEIKQGTYNSLSKLLGFLEDTVKYPVVEKLIKLNLTAEYFTIKELKLPLTEDSVEAVLGISKSLLKAYRKAKEAYGFKNYIMETKTLYRDFPEANTDDIIWGVLNEIYRTASDIPRIVPELTLHQIAGYLERVRLMQLYVPRQAIVEWRDYLSACKSIDMDMHDRKVLYPRALKTEHDIVVAKAKFIHNESVEHDFAASVEEYKKLEYHRDNYFIKVPESTQSMLEEGRKLNHCCGRYIDDVVKKTAFVLFLRQKSDPDTPYLSIEVLPDMTVRQVRGLNDSYVSALPEHKEISIFLHHWADAKHLTLKIE